MTSLPRVYARLVFVLAALGFASLAHAAVTLNVGLGPDPIRIGEVVFGEITVANNGGSSVANITVNVTIPTTVTAFSPALFTGGPGTLPACPVGTANCDPGEVVTWTIGTLPAGATATLTFPAVVTASNPNGTPVTLGAELFVNAISSGTGSRTVTGSTANALTLSVDDREDSVAPGAALTYDLAYGNRGGASLTATTLTFPVPAGTTFVSASGGGSFAAGVVTWSLGTLVAGDAGRQQVVVTAGALGDGQLIVVDAAAISGTGTGLETANGRAVTAVRASQPLGVALEVNPDPVRPQEPMHVDLTVTNRSGSALSNVKALLRMPDTIAALSPALLTGGPGTLPGCGGYGTANCDLDEPITWTIGTLPAGASATLSLPPNLAAGIADGRLTGWKVIVLADSNTIARASRTVVTDSSNALSLNVDDREDSVAPGAALTYDLTYGNRGGASLTSTTLTFPVPAGTTFVSASGGGTLAAGVVTWSLGTLVAGDSGRQQVVVTAGAGLGDGQLIVVDAAAITGTGSLQENARTQAFTAVRASQPLGVGLEVNPDPVRPQEQMHVHLTVTNRSGSALSNVKAILRMPETIAAFSPALLSGGPGTLPVCGGFGTANCDAYEALAWTVGTLPAGASATLSLPPSLAAGIADGRLTGWDVIALADNNTIARASHSLVTDNGNALALSADESANPVAPGATLTYNLTYGNRGMSSLTGTTLAFPVPAGTTFVSASGGGTLSAGIVTWNLGTLVAGDSGRRQVSVTAGAGLGDGQLIVVDGAAITGAGALQENARALAFTTVKANAPLGVGLEVNADPARPNEPMHTRVTVTNRSGLALSNVKALLRVPDTITAFSPALFMGGPGTLPGCGGFGTANCDITEPVTWTIGTLTGGAGATLSLPPNLAAAIENGRLTGWEVIVLADNNTIAQTTHTVATDSTDPLLLSVDDSVDAVPTGSNLTYDLTYGNRGAGSLTGATLSFPIPAGATLVGHTGGTVTGSTINWSLGTLTAGQGGKRRVVVSVGAGANPGDLLAIDAAELGGTASTAKTARGTAISRIATAPALQLVSGMSPNPVQDGQTLTTTLTLTNTTGSTLSGVVLHLRVPNFVTAFSPVLLSPAGPSCGGFGTANCDITEALTWTVGTLGPGASFVASIPPVVPAVSGPVNGQLIPITALAEDGNGNAAAATNTALVNPFTDTDGDGVAQVFDNCTAIANPDQRDSDYDGYGNRCDGDLDENNTVTATDFALLRSVLGQLATSSALAAAADLDGNGTVTATDYAILRSALGLAPGPSAMAP